MNLYVTKLYCLGCRQYKPDEYFAYNHLEVGRRGRQKLCRYCEKPKTTTETSLPTNP